MSIEQLLQANIAALEANTAALLGKTGTTKKAAADDGDDTDTKPLTAAQKKAAAAKKAAEDDDGDAKPARAKKITREDLTALMNTVKEDLGAPVAKKLIKDVAGVERLAEVDDDDIKELFDAATKKLKAADSKADDNDI